MHKISYAQIKDLLKVKPRSPAITMYLPTHKTASPPHMREDQLRFKNLCSKASELLETRDKHNEFNREFKDKCERLLENQEFWKSKSESMLLCARPGDFTYYHLPIDSDEYVAVDGHFHLAPVIGLLNEMQDYYVLTVSRKNPVLLKGDAYELSSTSVELPESIESALNIDEMHQKSVQHSTIQGGGGAEFHGHGSIKDSGYDERLRFFRMIDNLVYLHAETPLPLILAGVESDVAEYRSQSRRPNQLERHIEGHFSAKDTIVLHEKAKALIDDEITAPSHQKALAEYNQVYGNLNADDMSDIKDAAEKGRVKTLLIAMSQKTRDTVRDNMTEVRKLIFPNDKISQAVDYIAWKVIHQGGKIVNLNQGEMPSGKLILSINRY